MAVADRSSEHENAFLQVVEAAWWEAAEYPPTATQEARDAVLPNRHGQLDPSDPDEFAIHDTYTYQRHHADACVQALQYAGIEPPQPKKPLVVVDIGAGACTVAVALGERWPQKLPSVHYYAVEPHPKMRALGTQLRGKLDWPFGHVQAARHIDDIFKQLDSQVSERTDSFRALVAFNYVIQQESIKKEHLSEWGAFLHRLVARGHFIELLIVKATTLSIGDHTGALLEKLNKLEIRSQKRCDRSFNFDSRYPNSVRLSLGPESNVDVWESGPMAKASCQLYVLSAA